MTILQVFVDDQEIGTMLIVFEFSNQKAAGNRRPHVALCHFHVSINLLEARLWACSGTSG